METPDQVPGMCLGRRSQCLADVDPIEQSTAVDGLELANILMVVVAKSFATILTMRHARNLQHWSL